MHVCQRANVCFLCTHTHFYAASFGVLGVRNVCHPSPAVRCVVRLGRNNGFIVSAARVLNPQFSCANEADKGVVAENQFYLLILSGNKESVYVCVCEWRQNKAEKVTLRNYPLFLSLSLFILSLFVFRFLSAFFSLSFHITTRRLPLCTCYTKNLRQKVEGQTGRQRERETE